jgi:hypothetical protein
LIFAAILVFYPRFNNFKSKTSTGAASIQARKPEIIDLINANTPIQRNLQTPGSFFATLALSSTQCNSKPMDSRELPDLSGVVVL